VLPGVAPVELVVARNATAVVYVGRCSAYPAGFELEVRVLLAAGADLDPSLNGPHHYPGRGSSYEEMLKFGLEFSDGRKVTNVGWHPGGAGEPEHPVLHSMGGGGGGGGGRWEQDFWVWPLPPAGALTFVCEWPAAGVALSRAETDAQPLLDAAARAVALFPAQPSAAGQRHLS
jgi:hypothetical protein